MLEWAPWLITSPREATGGSRLLGPRRDRRSTGWGLLAGAILAGSAWWASEAVARMEPVRTALRTLSARRHFTLSAEHQGPGIYTGLLRGPQGRRAPLAGSAAAWFGWVTVRVQEGRRNGRTVHFCDGGQYDGLYLQSGGVSVPVEMIPSNVAPSSAVVMVHGRDRVRPRTTVPIFLLGEAATGETVPWAAVQRCGMPTTDRATSYAEVAVPQDTPVAVSGCLHDGVLGPCRDGWDFVAVGGSAAMARAWGDGALAPVRLRLVLVAVVAGLCGVLFARRRVSFGPRSRPRREGRGP